jgi:hypothetical protein
MRAVLKVATIVAVIAAALVTTPVAPASAAVATPTFSGHWLSVLTCTTPGCAQAPTSFSFDFVQNGSAITGNATFAGSTATPVTGTASGLSATILGLTDSSTIQITMSGDGATFTGTVTITDPTSGVTKMFGTVTGSRREEASLTVVVSAKVPDAGLGIRRSAQVTVQVTAIGGAVNGIELQDLLVSSPALEVTSSPSDLSGFSLADGQSRSFVFGVKGVEAGEVTVIATADGTDAAGDTVDGNGSLEVKVGGPQLALTVSGVPESVSIKTGAGGQGRFVTVKVKFTNVGKEPVENIQLLSLSPVPVDHTQALKKLGFPAADFPRQVGTIAPGKSANETFRLDATGGFGTYEVEALALFDDPSAEGGNGRALATGSRFQVVTTTLQRLVYRNQKGGEIVTYYDPATGAILGKLTIVDPRTGQYDVLFYDKATGAIDLRNPDTGAPLNMVYDPSRSGVIVADPSGGIQWKLQYNSKESTFEFKDPGTGHTYPVSYNQTTGKFKAA